jgi:hypothetical protein
VYEAQVRRYEEGKKKEDAEQEPSTADPAIASADIEKAWPRTQTAKVARETGESPISRLRNFSLCLRISG